MDRYTNQDGSGFQPGIVELDVIFTAGTAGAVPTSFGAFTMADGLDGTTPASLAATGKYTFNLADAYVALLPGSSFTVIQASYDATHARSGDVITNSVTDGTTPLVTFQAVNSAGAATAVTATDIVMVHLRLQRMTGDH